MHRRAQADEQGRHLPGQFPRCGDEGGIAVGQGAVGFEQAPQERGHHVGRRKPDEPGDPCGATAFLGETVEPEEFLDRAVVDEKSDGTVAPLLHPVNPYPKQPFHQAGHFFH